MRLVYFYLRLIFISFIATCSEQYPVLRTVLEDYNAQREVYN